MLPDLPVIPDGDLKGDADHRRTRTAVRFATAVGRSVLLKLKKANRLVVLRSSSSRSNSSRGRSHILAARGLLGRHDPIEKGSAALALEIRVFRYVLSALT